MSRQAKKLNWLNIGFFTIVPLIAIVGSIYWVSSGSFSVNTIWLAVILTIFGGLSITAGYHRLYSHGTYEASWPARLFFLLFGAGTFEGSVLDWCTDHYNHHRYTDTERDPYNIKQSFWHAHIGWLFTLDPSKRDYSNVDNIAADPLAKWQDKHYVAIAIFTGFILPVLIAGFAWGDWLGGFVFAGALRVTLAQHTTFCINSVCHYFGKQPYSDRNTARDNWFTAIFTFGEGYHNFHHKFPVDYRNGLRYYDFDPAKWLIATMSFFGMARNLRRVSAQRIIKAKMERAQSTMSAELLASGNAMLHQAYDSVMQALSRVSELEASYHQLKADPVKFLKSKSEEPRKAIKAYRQRLRQANADLKRAFNDWVAVSKGVAATA